MWKRQRTWMVIGVAAIVAVFLLQVQSSHWRSSLLDTLPADADPYHQAYQTSQQPNEQQLLLWLQVPLQDAAALRQAVAADLADLANGQPEITVSSQLALAPLLDFYRRNAGQLATETDRQRLRDTPEQLVAAAKLRLQQPSPLLTDVVADPLLLTQRYIEQLPDLLPGFHFDDPFYVREGAHYELVVALQSGADALSQAEAARVVTKIEKMNLQLQQAFPELEIARSGLVFHANAAADQAKLEMTWFGGLSLLLVVLMLGLVFGTIRHLMFTLVALSLASLVGFTAVMLVFPAPHVLILVFATTLIGLCIDYVFHASIASSHGRESWRAVVPALWLGALTTIVGYLLLIAVPLPLLQQLGVFMAAALLVVLLLVVYVLPRWRPWQAPRRSWQKLHERLAHCYSFNRHPAVPWVILGTAALLVTTLVYKYESNDSVRQLASSPAKLLQQEQKVRQRTQAYFDADVLLVKAANETEVAATYAAVAAHLPELRQAGLLERWQSLFDYVLTPAQQAEVIAAQQQFWQQPEGQAYLQWLGIDAPSLAGRGTPTHVAEHPLYSLFVYPMAQESTATGQANGYLGIIRLAGVTDRHALASALADYPQVELYNPLVQASAALGHHRQQLQFWLLGLLLTAAILLSVRLRQHQPWRHRIFVSLQVIAVITVALSAALLIAMQIQALNVFHWVGAILVLVLGLDYGIFCASQVRREHVLQAISLSALTTAIAFGALSFSATPAIAAFGNVVLIGVIISALLAPCIKPTPPSNDLGT